MRNAGGVTAVGARVKTGYATMVLVAGPASAPRVLDRMRVELCDPSRPESRQPYHAGFGTERTDRRAVARLVAIVERCGCGAVKQALGAYQAMGCRPDAAAVVVGSLIDPATIANPHIRAHASEGRLFGRVVAEALAEAGLECLTWIEKELYGIAAARLGLPDPAVRKLAAELGRGVAGGWRADEKAAAVAALLALGKR